MNAEELLQAVIKPDDTTEDTRKERLSAIIAGGGSRQYLGKDIQLSDIDGMTPEEINKLYCRYEARLCAGMTKTLGNSIINLYVMGMTKLFSITNTKLIDDLEEDPFVNHALTTACCDLYYTYGMYLAPITTMLTTVRHIYFNKNKNTYIENNTDWESREPSTEWRTTE